MFCSQFFLQKNNLSVDIFYYQKDIETDHQLKSTQQIESHSFITSVLFKVKQEI